MSDDAFKAAEQRGYSKGYRAGQARKKRLIDKERRAAVREAFIERAFLALLPPLFAPGAGWGVTRSGKHTPYGKDELLDFAWKTAIEAWDHRRFY
jgi:hypothetical protein